jgi:hypothetical protein
MSFVTSTGGGKAQKLAVSINETGSMESSSARRLSCADRWIGLIWIVRWGN